MATTGWYNDESDPTLARWHDGDAWTEHVVAKADWEGYGPPPPPDELEPRASRRLPAVLAAAAVVAVMVVAGAALARDGDGQPDRAPTGGQSDSTDRVSDRPDDVVDTSALDLGAVEPIFGGDTGEDPGTSAAGGGTTGTTKTATKGAAGSGSVQRSETSTQTHSNTAPISSGPSSDKTSVGNKKDQTLQDIYKPTPDTTPPTTADNTPPTEPTTTTTTS